MHTRDTLKRNVWLHIYTYIHRENSKGSFEENKCIVYLHKMILNVGYCSVMIINNPLQLFVVVCRFFKTEIHLKSFT